MATTSKQDADFLESVIGSTLLEESIDWIQANLDPEDVFSVETLRDWAEDNGYVEEE